MNHLKMIAFAFGVMLSLPMAPGSAEDSAQSGEDAGAPKKCLRLRSTPSPAMLFASTPGAPVEPPPKSTFQPCKPRGHDEDAWTVYEHASGCGD